MINFEHSEYLWLLTAIALFTLLFILNHKQQRKRLESYATANMLPSQVPQLSARRPAVKFALLMIAFAFAIIALANPRAGTGTVEAERLGSDIALCIDLSNSMKAEDIKPNRLERCRRVTHTLIDQLNGDRLSLIIFAGNAYIQMPLTSDYSAAKMIIDQLDCNMISLQGTNIAQAINKAVESLTPEELNSQPIAHGRSIVIISDGEDHEQQALDEARKAAAQGFVIHTIGMGLPQGTPIPQYQGSQFRGYRKDRNGQTVTTKLNEAMLADIAHAGKGTYTRANNANVSDIVKQLRKAEKEKYGEASFTVYESRYQYPLGAAIAFLLMELLIFEKHNLRFNFSQLLKRQEPTE